MSAIRFEVERETGAGLARAGSVHTPHGSFQTPVFCTVGTKGTVKGVTPDILKQIGVEVPLANTYHLFLQPGDETVKKLGGLHTFMGWDGPLVTDSGGYQVFSLGAAYGKGISKFTSVAAPSPTGGQGGNVSDGAAPSVYDEEIASQHGRLAIVDEEGVTFTSHIDGSLHRLTPERSVEIQHNLGADIFFAFDEPTSPTASREYQKDAMRRTHAWAERSLKAHRQNLDAQKSQAIFGIVQGGPHPDLREESARAIAAMDFDGYGIGGSYSKAELEVALSAAIAPLDPTKPRHLLGIGEPEDLFEGVARGIDMFDCVLPTRLGRTGTIFTKAGKMNLNRAECATRTESFSDVPGFEKYSFGYMHHLFRANEMLGPLLASVHNLHFIVSLVANIRQSVLDGAFDTYRNEFLSRYQRP